MCPRNRVKSITLVQRLHHLRGWSAALLPFALNRKSVASSPRQHDTLLRQPTGTTPDAHNKPLPILAPSRITHHATFLIFALFACALVQSFARSPPSFYPSPVWLRNGAAIQPRGRAAEGDARPSLAAIACCAALRGNTRLANRRTVAAARSVGGNILFICVSQFIHVFLYVKSHASIVKSIDSKRE
jgi:hypothetical protein